jgi:transcriptional regulator with XRE-family HTH domain
MFGEFVRELRIKERIGLREFCKQTALDPSNWSKTERELLPPPQDEGILKAVATALRLKKGSDDWNRLFELAALERGKLPINTMDDKKLLKSLPMFFRTLRGQKPGKDELLKLVEIIRRS